MGKRNLLTASLLMAGLVLLINRSTYSQLTTQFNQNIEKMAIDRVVNDGDDIVVIDMEFETDIDYRLNTSGGEMFDNLHPFVGGHEKMAVRWFEALQEVLPRPNRISKEISDSDSNTIDFDPGNRVKVGLVALYSFTEGKGNRVYDVSGVGSPLDLYINYEGNIIWDSVQGLEVTRKAILIPSDMNMKVIDSCMASNAISLETWIRTGNIEQDGPAHIVSVSDPLESGITISQEFFPDPMTTFNVAGKGRYIRIQLSDSQNICLAELMVMGSHLKTP